MNLGGPEVVVIVALGLLSLGLPIWALIDLGGYPDEAWAATGQSKTLWIVLLIVTTLLCGIGWVLAIVYLLTARPGLRAAAAGPA